MSEDKIERARKRIKDLIRTCIVGREDAQLAKLLISDKEQLMFLELDLIEILNLLKPQESTTVQKTLGVE